MKMKTFKWSNIYILFILYTIQNQEEFIWKERREEAKGGEKKIKRAGNEYLLRNNC